MSIPIYRHNHDHDDWEVASVYGSDDCDSMGRSACDESLHSEASFNGPAMRMQGRLYQDTRPLVRYSVPQQQPQNYPSVALTRPRWDARYVPAKQPTKQNFVVPPPGVIFPSKDWAGPPQDTYWPSAPIQIAPTPGPVDVGLADSPPPSLLLSPSSPPSASALIKLPSATSIAHGQVPHATSLTVSGTGTRANVNTHVSAMMPPPPRYHEPAPTSPPRLAEAGCQAHSSMSPPRRSGHDLLASSYAGPVGHASMLRGALSNEEMTVVDGRTGYGGVSYDLGDRSDLHPQANKYEYGCGYGSARLQTRERRPSVWRRFVRRFGPSRVSVGQT